MGHILTETPEMGEYHSEVRRESFYISGEDNFVPKGMGGGYEPRRHAVTVYEHGDCGQGTAEFLIEDIPKIRAVLDAVEAYVAKR
jgi:hypothetical protein